MAESEQDKPRLFDSPRVTRRVVWSLLAICGVALAADLVVNRYVEHPWEALFGFYAFYGFGACVLLVLAAKELRKIVQRPEDYYDD